MDRERIIQIAKQCGLKVTLDSENPGVFIKKDGITRKLTPEELIDTIFPELKERRTPSDR